MKRLVLSLILLPMLAFGQYQTFVKEHTYRASDDDGINQARAKAITEAQSRLLNEVGVLVENKQKLVKTNTTVDYRQEINTYTLGKVKTTVKVGTEKWDGRTFSATFQMVVDTAALFEHLDNIVKQKQQHVNDSLAKEQKIDRLKAAVADAKKTLESEEMNENNLRIERDAKYNEMKNAEIQKNEAQNSYNRATQLQNIERINFELTQITKTKNLYEKSQREYNIAEQNWSAANERVKAARNNLRDVEDNLAKETGLQSITSPSTLAPIIYTPISRTVPQTGKTKKYRDDSWKDKIMWFGGYFGNSFIDRDKNDKSSKFNIGGIIAMDMRGLGVPLGFQIEFCGVKTEYAYFLTENGDKKWDGGEYHIPYGTDYEYIKSSKTSFMMPMMMKLVFRPGVFSIEPYLGGYVGGNTQSVETGKKYDDGTDMHGGGGGFLFGGTLGISLFNSRAILFIDTRRGISGVSSQEEFTALSAGVKFGVGG